MKFSIPNYALAGENVLIMQPLVFSNLYNQIRSYLGINTTLEKRQYAFKDRCSRYVELKETMSLPKGYKMVQDNREITTSEDPVASFSGYVKQENNQLQILQKLTLGKRVYEAEDWKAFREAVNAHKSFAGEQFIFEK